MTLHDSLGNPVVLDDPGSLPLINDFVEGFIACEARCVNLLLAPTLDPAPLPQALGAALHMFAESTAGRQAASPLIARASQSTVPVSAREARLISAIGAWVDGDIPRAIRLHEEQARECPRDLVSLKLGQYHLFNRGDTVGMLRLALKARHAVFDVPYFHGMLAFAWEQTDFLKEAEVSARHAIAMCRKEPWAHHALAHVMLTQGRLSEGLEFLGDVCDTWTDLNSFMESHNWWHAALFALELGEYNEALRLYDDQVWGIQRDYSQDQVNAVSLLCRLELAGIDVGQRWDDVAGHLCQRTPDHVLPFLDAHYLYGLARAGRPEAEQLLAHIDAHANSLAHSNDSWAKAAWHEVALPLCHGLLAYAQQEWARAADQLSRAQPRLIEIGGSHAQRDLFDLLHLDALWRAGRTSHAQHLLQCRVNQQPESKRQQAQAARFYRELGFDAFSSRV